MSYYDPPFGSFRGTRRRDSFEEDIRARCYGEDFDSRFPRDYSSRGPSDETFRGGVHSPPPGMPHIYHDHNDSESDSYAHSSTRFYTRPSPNSYSPPSPRPESPLPHQPVTDHTPALYTYEDEEPERIPIAPMPWNNHSSSASKEELTAFFVGQGCHPKRAAAQVDREFSAHAPQHVAGRGEPGLPRAREHVRDPPRSSRFNDASQPRASYRSTSPNRHMPPPRPRTSYRTPSPTRHTPSPGPSTRTGMPRSRPPEYHRTPSPPPAREPGAPRYGSAPWYSYPPWDEEPVRRTRSRREGRESTRTPSPPPAASYAAAYREMPRRHWSRRERG